ncbi:DUF3331 domain-containing protein [Paraburkholderia sp. GAS334]|uniref:DUF3331 domain-containing protein n=1 Tax=Paraburkholderia sp. GAS334 TaxID=3035131 RepID=UPI003D1CD628
MTPCTSHDDSSPPRSPAGISRVIVKIRPVPTAITIPRPDAWTQILAVLSQCSAHSIALRETPGVSASVRTPCVRRPATGPNRAPSSTITIIEKLSDTLVSLSWHDSTLCNYEEQIWTFRHARSAGCCALSGKPIRRGDSIYRPRGRGKEPPLNRSEMILASELARVQCVASLPQTTEAMNE